MSRLEGPGRGPLPHHRAATGVTGNACLCCALACRDTGGEAVVPPPTVGERGRAQGAPTQASMGKTRFVSKRLVKHVESGEGSAG